MRFWNKLSKKFNKFVSNVCNEFVDNIVSIYFWEEKTKSILFGTKKKLKKESSLTLDLA